MISFTLKELADRLAAIGYFGEAAQLLLEVADQHLVLALRLR